MSFDTKCWWRDGRNGRSPASWGLARVTVRKYLEEAAPTRVEGAARPRPVWDAVAGRVHALLAESVRWTGGKQRLTATRLHDLLRTEGVQTGYIGNTTNREHG